MASFALPPISSEVWSRIFFFVAPPLPHVGIELASFAEDAKGWRGDHAPKGAWTDINNLMLVSKHINELVSPVFWSFVVLTSQTRAANLVNKMILRSTPERMEFRQFVKVVHMPGDLDIKSGEHPCLRLLRWFDNAVHIHLESEPDIPTSLPLLVSLAMRLPDLYTPLRGLTGVILGRSNFEAVTLALRQLAPSLRQLSVSTLDRKAPHSARPSNSHRQLVSFPCLVSLSMGSSGGPPDPAWLEYTLASRWDMPVLAKIAVGVRLSTKVLRGPSSMDFAADGKLHEAIFVPDLPNVGANIDQITALRPRELALGLELPDEVAMDSYLFCRNLDGARGGQLDTVRVVVVCEGARQRSSEDQQDRCLVELVSRKRLPSLEKVVWVANSPKNTDDANWSGLLLKWTHDLIKAGIEFEVQ